MLINQSIIIQSNGIINYLLTHTKHSIQIIIQLWLPKAFKGIKSYCYEYENRLIFRRFMLSIIIIIIIITITTTAAKKKTKNISVMFRTINQFLWAF